MKLEYVRFVKQAVTDRLPLTQWLATQKLCRDSLLGSSQKWVESAEAVSELPVNSPTLFAPSEKYDAYKATMTTAGASTESAAMGCACYRFKVPQDAIDNSKFFRSVELTLAADKFNVAGLRVMAHVGNKGGSETWSEFLDRVFLADYPNGGAVSELYKTAEFSDAKGAFGILADRADKISAAANASGAFTLAGTPSANADYLFVFVGLYDYEAVRVDASARQTREYWFEGSGVLVGSMAEFAFASAVVPDEDYGAVVAERMIFSGASDFSSVMVRPILTETRGEDTVVSMPIEAFQASFFRTDLEFAHHIDHYPDAAEQRAVFARLQMHVFANLKNVDSNPDGAFVQHALAESDASYADRTASLGLCAAYILYPTVIAPEPVKVIPSLFASVLVVPVSLSRSARRIVLRHTAALSMSLGGAAVTLTGWFLPEAVVRTQPHGRSYSFVRALAGDLGFWRGDVATVARTDETQALGEVVASARRLFSVELPQTIPTGAEISADIILDVGERGYIVFAPNVRDVSAATLDVSLAAVGDNVFSVAAVGLGREYMPSQSGPMPYDLDYSRSDFSRTLSGFNLPSANIGWKPEIYLF